MLEEVQIFEKHKISSIG